jgi:hypothetical protein
MLNKVLDKIYPDGIPKSTGQLSALQQPRSKSHSRENAFFLWKNEI